MTCVFQSYIQFLGTLHIIFGTIMLTTNVCSTILDIHYRRIQARNHYISFHSSMVYPTMTGMLIVRYSLNFSMDHVQLIVRSINAFCVCVC